MGKPLLKLRHLRIRETNCFDRQYQGRWRCVVKLRRMVRTRCVRRPKPHPSQLYDGQTVRAGEDKPLVSTVLRRFG